MIVINIILNDQEEINIIKNKLANIKSKKNKLWEDLNLSIEDNQHTINLKFKKNIKEYSQTEKKLNDKLDKLKIIYNNNIFYFNKDYKKYKISKNNCDYIHEKLSNNIRCSKININNFKIILSDLRYYEYNKKNFNLRSKVWSNNLSNIYINNRNQDKISLMNQIFLISLGVYTGIYTEDIQEIIKDINNISPLNTGNIYHRNDLYIMDSNLRLRPNINHISVFYTNLFKDITLIL